MDNTLLYFILFLVCLWLLIDEVVGSKKIDRFIVKVFPNLEQTETSFFSKLMGVFK